MQIRPEFQCCHCDQTFGKVVDTEGDPVLLLECPFCHTRCSVDLAPFKHRVVEVMRGGADAPGRARYELPERVPTVKVAEGE
jgi:hypothetical protein